MMKLKISALATLSAGIMAASCQFSATPENERADYRMVTVTTESLGTKTSIENEYSDWTHLVWNDGDMVAYVTDCGTDVVKTASVSSDGTFTAEIPAEATVSNTLYVAYPPDGLEGKTLTDLKIEIGETNTQEGMTSSAGVDVPMFASAQVPAAGETTVSVKYEIPAAIVRFNITSSEYAADQLTSVTMEAGVPLSGSVSVPESGDGMFAYEGGSGSVTTTISTLSPISEGGYVYLPVMRGDYSDVTVTVKTDKNTFRFEGGNFSLSNPDATVYKVTLNLGEAAAVPPDPYFAEISEGEQFSAENKYLVTYRHSSLSYRVAADHISSKIDGMTFEVDPDLGGIPAKGDVLNYVFTIAPVAGAEGKYYLYSEAAGNTNGNYIGSAGGTSTAGNFFFMKTEPTASDTYYIWDITYGDGVQYIYNEGRNRYMKYSSSLTYFVTSSVGEDNSGNEDILDLTILKLIGEVDAAQ